MKKFGTMLSFLAIFMMVSASVFLPGCEFGRVTSSSTVTDDEGNTTTEDSTSVLADVTEEDITTMSSIVTIASNVWDLVSVILLAVKDVDTNDATTITSITNDNGIVMTKEDVLKKANVIALMCFRECGKLPSAEEIVVYVRTGTLPSESALIRFSETGMLSE